MKRPKWKEWQHTPEVHCWQACALSLDIDPRSMMHLRDSWMAGPGLGPFFEPESFPSKAIQEEFELRLRVLLANLSNRRFFSAGILDMTTPGKCGVRLSEFAAWAVSEVKWNDLPPELVSLARPPAVVVQELRQSQTKPVARSQAQDEAILEAIRTRKIDPKQLPKMPQGKSTVKAEIRRDLTKTQKHNFGSEGVFNDAWQRLRNSGEIQDQSG